MNGVTLTQKSLSQKEQTRLKVLISVQVDQAVKGVGEWVTRKAAYMSVQG